jgi:hypothetical protein
VRSGGVCSWWEVGFWSHRFRVGASGKNLVSVAVKKYSRITDVIKQFYKFFTFQCDLQR